MVQRWDERAFLLTGDVVTPSTVALLKGKEIQLVFKVGGREGILLVWYSHGAVTLGVSGPICYGYSTSKSSQSYLVSASDFFPEFLSWELLTCQGGASTHRGYGSTNILGIGAAAIRRVHGTADHIVILGTALITHWKKTSLVSWSNKESLLYITD